MSSNNGGNNEYSEVEVTMYRPPIETSGLPKYDHPAKSDMVSDGAPVSTSGSCAPVLVLGVLALVVLVVVLAAIWFCM